MAGHEKAFRFRSLECWRVRAVALSRAQVVFKDDSRLVDTYSA